jgi:hypothetical protein
MYTYLQTPTRHSTSTSPKPLPLRLRYRLEKPLILICFLLTLFLSCIDMYEVYEIGIPHFTDTLFLYEIKWPEGVGAIGNGLVHSVVQGWFGARLVKVRTVEMGGGEVEVIGADHEGFHFGTDAQLMSLSARYGLPIYMFITAGLVPSIGTGVKLLVSPPLLLQRDQPNPLPFPPRSSPLLWL